MGGSGGGSSGTIVYPGYIQDVHARWLDSEGVDIPDMSLVAAMNAASGASPFAGVVAFNPNTYIAAMDTALSGLNGIVAALNSITDFNATVVAARGKFVAGTSTLDTTTLDSETITEAEITADMNALDAVLTEHLEDNDLVRFKAGMLNIGAVSSSSFAIGEAVLRGMKGRSVAQHGSQLRIQLGQQVRELNTRHKVSYRTITAQHQRDHRQRTLQYYVAAEDTVRVAAAMMMDQLLKNASAFHNFTHILVEMRRIQAVLKKEESEEQMSIDESDALWDLNVFRGAGNLLAGPGGGVAQANDKKNKAMSALGGAISGVSMGLATTAAIGAAAGAPVGGVGALAGAAIGAAVGVGLSLAAD